MDINVLGNYIKDERIQSKNYMLELSLLDYYYLSKDILNNNEYQRRRVKSSFSVYSLLRDDIKRGCLMPPLVLALSADTSEEVDIRQLVDSQKNKLVILDGLQRSYTIRDIVEELGAESGHPALSNKIRIEVYVGINKLGILYRMLTLNTGQTPMSTRHQIEIIYSDYIETNIEGIRLIREVDDSAPRGLGEYKFRDVIEGFTSLLERDYLTLERTDILENIKSLENLSSMDVKNELFEDFLKIYHKFVVLLQESCAEWHANDNIDGWNVRPFARDVVSIFNKSQSLTGFGCAVGKLIDAQIVKDIDFIDAAILKIQCSYEGLDHLILQLDRVRNRAKKIGNDQRLYFYYFFRHLFNSESEGYLDIKNAADMAFGSYERETC